MWNQWSSTPSDPESLWKAFQPYKEACFLHQPFRNKLPPLEGYFAYSGEGDESLLLLRKHQAATTTACQPAGYSGSHFAAVVVLRL